MAGAVPAADRARDELFDRVACYTQTLAIALAVTIGGPMTQEVAFYSDGIRLQGLLHIPDGASSERPRPTIVICSGLFGLKEWVPSRWWPQFLEAGFTCLAFDYRGFGTSDGERGRVDPWEQVRDVIHAVTFLAQQACVDRKAIGVMGWGLGAGVAVSAAARDDRIAAVAAVSGPGDVGRVTRDGVPYAVWLERQERLARDRVRRVLTGESEAISYREITHPGGFFDFGVKEPQFDKDLSELGQTPTAEFTLESAEAYYRFRPELEVGSISPRPVLIVHGTKDRYVPIDEAQRVYALANEPKTLLEIPGAAHLEWIARDSKFYRPNVAKVVSWFADALDEPSPVVERGLLGQ